MGNPNVFRLIVTDDDLDLGHFVSVCDLPGLRVAAAHIVMCPSLLIFCLQYPAWMLAWYHWCDLP